MVKEYR